MRATTRIFQSNKSQAFRLPKSVAFPANVSEVSITTVGVTRVVAPVNQSWDSWFDSMAVEDDYMVDRQQPEAQTREAFDD